MEFRDIPGYDGWYQINEQGDVRSWRVHGRKLQRANPPRILRGFWKNGQRTYILLDMEAVKHCKTVKYLMAEVGFPVDKLLKHRPVEKLDEHGNVVARYPSIQAAADANFVSHPAIRFYCEGKNLNRFDGEFTFRYAGPKTNSGRKKRT